MVSKEQAQLYMNHFAHALSIVNLFPSCFSEIYALCDFENKFTTMSERLKSLDLSNPDAFLEKLKNIISETTQEDEATKPIYALSICKYLDSKLSYLADCQNAFSIYPLVQLSNNKAVTLNAPLNTNCDETGIWMNPKFPACLLYERSIPPQKDRRLFNRDSFIGLNGELENCCFVKWDNSLSITNIVVPAEFLAERQTRRLKIGFSPLSDNIDLLDINTAPIKRNGIDFNGEYLNKIKRPDLIMERFRYSWRLACDNDADISFAPEMLCTTDMFDSADGCNLLIQELALEMLGQGSTVPSLTLLPSYWNQGTNSCQITYHDGQILGEQIKHFPFVDRKKCAIEAINSQERREITMVHIPGVHRIAVMICADFLTQQEDWLEKYICGQLQATLIIVPSYSAGEQDFINSLSIVKRYGASVIWGNCCGAKGKGEKQIGGCGTVENDSILRFGDACICQSSCKGAAGCVFIVDMPLEITGDKTHDKVFVTHYTKTDKV